MEPTIDKEFKNLLPPTTDAEREVLRESIMETEGNTEPGIVWQGRGIVVDGMNRKEVCDGEGFPFKFEERPFANRAEVRRWILMNQLGRRNLAPADAAMLRGRLYNGKKGQAGGSAAEIAEATGVTERTVRRNGKAAEAFDSLSSACQEYANGLSSELIIFAASLPKEDQLAFVKSAAKTAKPKKEPKQPAEPKTPAEQKAEIKHALGVATRKVTALRKELGGRGGSAVFELLDELMKKLNKWKV